ncbi:hypothetical protein J4231_01675 [Candidatus Woesearchaeota archaeon]|nr:hypothetical protein [Candidatus Woesearchaeota archaeon]
MPTGNDLPIGLALKFRQQGMANPQIISQLESQGYNPQQIAESLNQLGIKSSIEKGSASQSMQPSLLDEDMPIPTPPQQESQQSVPQSRIEYVPSSMEFSNDQSDIQALIESIIEERMQKYSDNLTEFEIWKSRVNDDIISIKQEILRVSGRFDNMQQVVIGRVDEYSKSVGDVTSEIKALEKVFQNIVNPLTSNIKELASLTKELKQKS